jgi:AcrR family transcriptional regulator/DNA-binding MarR family transcriptional regulator
MARARPAVRGSGPTTQVPEGKLPSGRHGLDRAQVQSIQRGRIVRATIGAALELGGANVTVAQVVSRSGVSRRTFYELFSGSEDCFLTAFDDSIERIAAVVVPANESERRTQRAHPPSHPTGHRRGAGDWRDRMRAGLCALLAFLDDEPGTGRLVLVESLGAGAPALERRARVLALLIAAVDEGRLEARRGAGPPPLTAEGVVGAVCSVLHTRLAGNDRTGLVQLANPLMSMIVLPYLGTAAARAELRRPAPRARPKAAAPESDGDLLKELGIRITYRTVRVLQSVGSSPGAGNRQIGEHAGIPDQGQISKLLHRLRRLGLVENGTGPVEPGGPNAWRLTPRGEAVERMIAQGTRR